MVGQVVQTLVATKPPKDKEEAGALVDEAIALTIHATRLALHSQINNASPGSVAFGRDMILNIPFLADFVMLQNLR